VLRCKVAIKRLTGSTQRKKKEEGRNGGVVVTDVATFGFGKDCRRGTSPIFGADPTALKRGKKEGRGFSPAPSRQTGSKTSNIIVIVKEGGSRGVLV